MLPSDTPPSTPPAEGSPPRPAWREPLTTYAQAHVGRAVLDIATSVVPYVGLCALMYVLLPISYPLVLALAFPTAGLAVRTFIV
ncbi:MAG TPA: fatty acid desaturase, partial [Solirubrobacteraceae bacterium]|nr:fatty acid desaturase [Solirubrobacteraceae bacterium]